MARPTKLSPAVREQIAESISVGNDSEVAAQAAGIGSRTFYDWMSRGESARQADRPYRLFREAVERARAEAETILVDRIARAAKNGSWSAAAWLLERGHPERWAKQSERKRVDEDKEAKPDPFAAIDELAERRAA